MKISKIKFILSVLILALMLINIPVTANESSISNTDLIILFKDSTIDSTVEQSIVKSGGKIIKEFNDLGSVEVKCSSELIPQITKYSSVDSVAPNHKIKIDTENIDEYSKYYIHNIQKADLYNKYQWDIKKITSNGKSFSLESGNHNTVVGIIDSGVNKNHPDLVSNFLGGENLIPNGFDNDISETGNSNDIEDRIGHGTHIAGTIAGNGNIMGVAPNIGFKSYRIFDSNGNTDASIISSAIIKATNDGIKVINLSTGGYYLKGKCSWTDSSTGKTYKLGNDMAACSLIKRAIKYAVKHSTIVVTSAGNESLDCSDKNSVTEYLNRVYGNQGFKYEGLTYEVPGTIKGVINVSSTGPTDKIASYSNYGAKFIDIAAPGGDFISDKTDMCFSTYKDGYTFMEGTSMAAPKVSAVAALVICKYGELTPKKVAEKIYKSAGILGDGNSREYFGNGLVSAYNALTNK